MLFQQADIIAIHRFSTNRYVNIANIIDIKISPSLRKIFPSEKFKILSKDSMGWCHRYSEYDIKPIPTNILLDKNFIIKSFL